VQKVRTANGLNLAENGGLQEERRRAQRGARV